MEVWPKRYEEEAHLDEVGLVLLISRCDEPVDLSPQSNLTTRAIISLEQVSCYAKLKGTPSLRHRREHTTLRAESFLDDSVLQVNHCVVYDQRAFYWPEQE